MLRSYFTTFTLVSCVASSAIVWAQEPKKGIDAPPKTTPAVKLDAVTIGEVERPKQLSPNEQAIHASAQNYVKVFNLHDAKALAELYTADAEYIDETGAVTQGRPAIEAGLKGFFTTNPDCKLALTVVTVRVIAPNVAIEDGFTTITTKKDAAPVTTRYTAIHSKGGDKWLLASVRDTALPQESEHRNRLKQFEWMLGEWVHDGPDATIVFECSSIANGNFLIRDFSVHFAGRETITGSQRIGWDSQAGKFKSWIFDSDGGYAEGYWHRDGEKWVLKVTGVTAGGKSASSTSIYAFENAHTMTFQSLDHEIAGEEFPDSAPVKIVRRPPRPN